MNKKDGSSVIASQVVLKVPRFTVFRDILRLENGKQKERFWLSHEPSVRIVCITKNGELVMVKEFKYASNEFVLAVPAGTWEPHETCIEAGRRELREEASFTAEEWFDLGPYFMAATLVKQDSRVLLAQGAVPCAPPDHLDAYEKERITPVLMRLADVFAAVRDGSLLDGQTLSALLKAFAFLGCLKVPNH
jgi:ADP-ribose pyrophosphatase